MPHSGDVYPEPIQQTQVEYERNCARLAATFAAAGWGALTEEQIYLCESQRNPEPSTRATSVGPPIVALASGTCSAVSLNRSVNQCTTPLASLDGGGSLGNTGMRPVGS